MPPPRRTYDPILVLAQAEKERRERQERRHLEELYDWYGLSCPCHLPPGKCRIHPRAAPYQRPPGTPGSPFGDVPWSTFLMQAGRGGGKTRAAAEFVRWKVETGKWKDFLILGATIGEVIKYQIGGPSGLVTISAPWCKATYLPSKSMIVFPETEASPNGARGYLATSEEPDSLRGGNLDGAWGDEPSKWKSQMSTWRQIQMVIRNRTDPPPQTVLSGTPSPTKLFLEFHKALAILRETAHYQLWGPAARMRVYRTVWATLENADHLSEEWLLEVQQALGGTLEGQQELGGLLIARTEGALWGPEDFDADDFRLHGEPPDLEYVGVGVDPASGSKRKYAADTGIIVAGRRRQGGLYQPGRGVVLDDYSCGGQPSEWGQATVRAYHDWQADEVVAEANQGGEMVAHVIRTVPAFESGGRSYPSGLNVPIRLVWASRGKQARAQPVQTLYAAGRIQHHGDRLATLESHMVNFRPEVIDHDLDRVDALVWILTGAILEHDAIGSAEPCLAGLGRPDLQYLGESRF